MPDSRTTSRCRVELAREARTLPGSGSYQPPTVGAGVIRKVKVNEMSSQEMNALRHVEGLQSKTVMALWALADATECPEACSAYRTAALAVCQQRMFVRQIIDGDIGKEEPAIEIVPLSEPVEVPVQEPAPREPVPA